MDENVEFHEFVDLRLRTRLTTLAKIWVKKWNLMDSWISDDERRHDRCFVAEVVDTCLKIILIPKQSLYYVRGLRYGRKCEFHEFVD